MIKTGLYMEKIERMYFKRCKENTPFKIDDIFCIKTDLAHWHFACEYPYLTYLEDGQNELKKLRKSVVTSLHYLEEDRHETKLFYIIIKYGNKKEATLRFRSQRTDNKFKIYKEDLNA